MHLPKDCLNSGSIFHVQTIQFLRTNKLNFSFFTIRVLCSSRHTVHCPCLYFDPNQSHITNSTGSHPNKVIPLKLFSARTHFCKQLLKCYRIHQKLNNRVYHIILGSLNMQMHRRGYARQHCVSSRFGVISLV